MARGTFPHLDVQINDQSRNPPAPQTPEGLHQAMFFFFSPRGPVNTPIRGNGGRLMDVFGDDVFNSRSDYFHHPNLFAREASSIQEVWGCRLIDTASTKAGMVIEAQVAEKSIQQYEKDATTGLYKRDGTGELVPGSEAKEQSLEITWNVRAINTASETFDTVTTTAITGSKGARTGTYPIMVLEASDLGASGNKLGVRFNFQRSQQNAQINEGIGALTLRFEPIQQVEGAGGSRWVGIRDTSNATVFDVSLKKDAFYEPTQTYYDLDRTADRRFSRIVGNSKETILRFRVRTLYDNLDTLYTLVRNAGAYESTEADADPARAEFPTTLAGPMIDIFTGMDTYDQEYGHLKVTNPTVFRRTSIHSLSGGSDGDITAANLEALTAAALDAETTPIPQLNDEARFPITHVYDSGYSISTKNKLIDFMSIRKDVKVDMCTQVWGEAANDADSDQSVGAALRTRARLHPESSLFGTEVMRCSIYQQSGTLITDRNITNKVPILLDRMRKRCRHESSQKVQGLPVNLPASSVDIFTDIAWTPSTDAQKQKSWSTGLNYVQHYDSQRVHFPDYRSVHPQDNSVLSDEITADHLVYVIHIARYVWAAFYVGSRVPSERLYSRIQREIDTRIFNALDGRVTTTTTLYKTEQDIANGFSDTMSLVINFPSVSRVLQVEIPVGRIG